MEHSALVHVVHPYTFKVEDGFPVIGDIARFKERDERIVRFLESVPRGSLLVHFNYHPNLSEHWFQMAGLYMDEKFSRVFNEQFIAEGNYVVTPNTGTPISDARPEKIPEERWRVLRELYTGKEVFQGLVARADEHVVIGGLFEACVTNAATHLARTVDAPITILENLCATEELMPREEAISGLSRFGVRVQDYR